MTVKILTEYDLEFLTLKGGYTGSSQSTHVKIPHCWNSHVTAHMGRDGRKPVFDGLRTTTAQTSLHIRAV